MKTKFAISLLLLLVASQAAAFTQLYRFQYCSSVPDGSERLQCYDNYARELGLVPPPDSEDISATQKVAGRWTIRGEATMDDTSVFVFTEGMAAFAHGANILVPTLIARCMEGRTELLVSFSSYFPVEVGPKKESSLYVRPARLQGSQGYSTLKGTVRFDDDAETEILFRTNDDHRAFFFPNPVSYLRQMKARGKMSFAAVARDHKRLNTVFELEGLDQALLQLRRQCEW